MITPTSGSITTQPETFDGIWLSSVQINAPTVIGKISAVVRATPFNSANGSLAPYSYGKTIVINDIMSASVASPEVGMAMGALIGAIQGQIISRSLF